MASRGGPGSNVGGGRGRDDASDPVDVSSMSFEDALEEVESIIERIETGELGLEASLDAYERGVALIRQCRGVLRSAEQRVDELGSLLDDDVADAGASPAGGVGRRSAGGAAASDRGPGGEARGDDVEDAPF